MADYQLQDIKRRNLELEEQISTLKNRNTEGPFRIEKQSSENSGDYQPFSGSKAKKFSMDSSKNGQTEEYKEQIDSLQMEL